MQIRKRLANNLRRLRKTKNLTQNNLALKSGINVTTIGYIEQEYVSTSVDTLEILAGALDSDPSMLLASESTNLNIGEYALCLNTKYGMKYFIIKNKLEFLLSFLDSNNLTETFKNLSKEYEYSVKKC